MTNLIESHFRLDTHILKEELRKAREKIPVEGYLNIAYNNKPSILDYRVEYEDGGTYLVIDLDSEPQRILLSEHFLTFGTRTYLTCSCGCRTNSLYLSKGFFACRRCHKLQYQSSTINRSTKHGNFLYKQSKILKIIEMRESMGRIFYRSEYSKRFTRWLSLCSSAGLLNEVADAKELILAINNQDQ